MSGAAVAAAVGLAAAAGIAAVAATKSGPDEQERQVHPVPTGPPAVAPVQSTPVITEVVAPATAAEADLSKPERF